MRTAALMAALMVLFVLIGQMLGGQQGMVLAFLFGIGVNFFSYWFSDKLVLKMYRAEEVGRAEAPELYDMVDRLRVEAGLPMPRVFVVPSDQPNAFATGRNPEHAAVAVTSGIVRLLSNKELEGVIAHELAHVKNRDILIGSIAAAVGVSITMLVRFGVLFGGRDRGNVVGSLLMLILAPIAAMLIQMAISRVREYSADRDGARICGSPRSLASALQKLQRGAEAVPMDANPSTAHMFIVSPFAGLGGEIKSLFSTHPPTEERVKRLLELERTEF
ncbi:MAG TPA: zinc metalloprotease HtpX [Rhodothermales bacterium]|nr:zinc metalloprotease HtpX [Rhodothermales bacterium]